MSFETIIGNEEIKQRLEKTLQNKAISHSYLFSGPSGIGKTLFAREFAKRIACLGEKQEEKCKSCLEFENQNHPDFFFLQPEDGKIKIEPVRQMIKNILEKPIISNYKIYLIKDADQMTKEAQNCLLKTLEEPPEYVLILLIVANENCLLTTIKSRCTKIAFQKIENTAIKEYLLSTKSVKELTPNQFALLNGSLEKIKILQENEELLTLLEEVFSKVEKITLLEAMEKLDILYQQKEKIGLLLEYSNVILLQKSRENKKYLKYIEIVENTRKNLQGNNNYEMNIDKMLYDIWEE